MGHFERRGIFRSQRSRLREDQDRGGIGERIEGQLEGDW